jgi:hypothetical protein
MAREKCCPKCKRRLPISSFPSNHRWCRDCNNARRRPAERKRWGWGFLNCSAIVSVKQLRTIPRTAIGDKQLLETLAEHASFGREQLQFLAKEAQFRPAIYEELLRLVEQHKPQHGVLGSV